MDVKHGLGDVEYVCELPAFCLEGTPKKKSLFHMYPGVHWVP